MRCLSRIIKATKVSMGTQVALDVQAEINKEVIEASRNPIQEIDEVVEVVEEKEPEKTKEEIEAMYIEEARKKSELFFEEEMKKAYEMGVANANQEANEIIENAKAESEKVIADAIKIKNSITTEYKDTMASMEKEILDLVLEISKRVIAKEITDDDYIIGIVSEALEKVSSKKDAVLKVSEEDYNFIKENKDKILLSVEGFGDVDLVKESSLERGSCLVESSLGIIDGGVKTRMLQIEQEVKKILNR